MATSRKSRSSASPTFESIDDRREFVEYLRVIRRNKWGIFSVAIVAGLLGALIGSSTTPVYKAEARLLVQPESEQVFAKDAKYNPANLLLFYQTQRELIRSRSLAEAVINKLKLNGHPDYFNDDRSLLERIQAGPFVSLLLGTDGSAQRQVRDSRKPRETADVIPIFQRRLDVETLGGSEVFLISYESFDPGLAARVANQVADAYIDTVARTHQAKAEQTVEWLTQKLETVRQKLVQSEAQLHAFQAKVKVGDSDAEKSVEKEKLSSITEELLRATTRRAEAEIRYQQVKAAKNKNVDYESLPQVLNNNLVQKFKEQEALLRRDVAELSDRYGDKHPKLIGARNELAIVQKRLAAEINDVIGGVRKEYELAMAHEREMRNVYERIQSEIHKTKGKEYDSAKLELEVSTNRELYDLLLTRLKEMDVSKKENIVNVRLIDPAKAPTAPFKPQVMRIVMIAMIIGFFIGIVAAFVRENLDETFKTGVELQEHLSLPLLGIFPIIRGRASRESRPERYVAKQPQSAITEAMNNIRTNVLFSSVERSLKVILVTSAVAEEGKTTISSNLAISLAKLGPTLLLEADLRKPRLRKFLRGRRDKAGIFEFVSGKNTLKQCVAKDAAVKNLFVMPVYRMPPNPLEFLSSARFKASLKHLRKYFRYIIIDAPPVLPISDSLVISRLADGIVFVAGAESTPRSVAGEAVARLEEVDARVLGAVLSRARPKTMAAHGGGYYSKYSYYYGNRSREAASI